MVVYKSGIKWDMASRLAYLSMFGWVIGVVPAIIDATIVVNHVMHNTKWVPGHFHMYMGVGAVVMLFSFMYYLAKVDSDVRYDVDKIGFFCYAIAMFSISIQFLVSGAISTPRRWATHFPEWMGPAQFGCHCRRIRSHRNFDFRYSFHSLHEEQRNCRKRICMKRNWRNHWQRH